MLDQFGNITNTMALASMNDSAGMASAMPSAADAAMFSTALMGGDATTTSVADDGSGLLASMTTPAVATAQDTAVDIPVSAAPMTTSVTSDAVAQNVAATGNTGTLQGGSIDDILATLGIPADVLSTEDRTALEALVSNALASGADMDSILNALRSGLGAGVASEMNATSADASSGTLAADQGANMLAASDTGPVGSMADASAMNGVDSAALANTSTVGDQNMSASDLMSMVSELMNQVGMIGDTLTSMMSQGDIGGGFRGGFEPRGMGFGGHHGMGGGRFC